MAAIPEQNPFNLVDIYRGCAGAGPPAEDAHARELQRAAKTLKMAREAASRLWPGEWDRPVSNR